MVAYFLILILTQLCHIFGVHILKFIYMTIINDIFNIIMAKVYSCVFFSSFHQLYIHNTIKNLPTNIPWNILKYFSLGKVPNAK